MKVADELPWDWLETQSAILFGVAVGMLLVANVHKVLEATAGVALNDYLLNVAGQGGVIVSLVALLALYPALSDRMPKLAKTGAGCIALGAVSFFIALLAMGVVLAVNAVIGIGLPIEAIGILFIPGYLGTVLGYLLFGIASMRTGIPSRLVGLMFLLLLLLPVGITAWFVVTGSSLIPNTVAGLGVLDIWLPLILLGVAVLLHTSSPLSDYGNTTPNPTTGE